MPISACTEHMALEFCRIREGEPAAIMYPHLLIAHCCWCPGRLEPRVSRLHVRSTLTATEPHQTHLLNVPRPRFHCLLNWRKGLGDCLYLVPQSMWYPTEIPWSIAIVELGKYANRGNGSDGRIQQLLIALREALKVPRYYSNIISICTSCN